MLPTVADAMIGVLRAVGDVADPVYGEIVVNHYPHSPSTALDRLLLRATEDPAGWTEEAARRVFDAVRPVLPPGQPRPLQYKTTTNVVMTDARLS